MNCSINLGIKISKDARSIWLRSAITSYLTNPINEEFSDILKEKVITKLYTVSGLGRNLDDPISTVYDFLGLQEAFIERFESIKESLTKPKKNKIVNELGEEVEVIEEVSPEILVNLSNFEELFNQVIEEGIAEFKSEISKKNVNIAVNPVFRSENSDKMKEFIRFRDINKVLENRHTLITEMEHELQMSIIKASLISFDSNLGYKNLLPPKKKYVLDNLDLNDNIVYIKSKWWLDIVKSVGRTQNVDNSLYILKKKENDSDPDEWVLNKKLFKKENNNSLSKYEEILIAMKNKYDELSDKSLKKDKRFTTLDSFIKMILFLHFDELIKSKSSLIVVNPDSSGTWGMPKNGNPKYYLKQNSLINTTWAPDSHGENSINDYESNLFKLLIPSIPLYSIDNIKTGQFLNTVQFNSLGGIVKNIKEPVFNGKTYFEFIDDIRKGTSTYQDLLAAMIGFSESNEDLYNLSSISISLYNYLYGDFKNYSRNQNISEAIKNKYSSVSSSGILGGVIDEYNLELTKNPESLLRIVRIEDILFYQFQHSINVGYEIVNINPKNGIARNVNSLAIDTKVKETLGSLFSSLAKSWKLYGKSMEEHKFWGSKLNSDFIDFLQTYGEITFSNRVIEKYKKHAKYIGEDKKEIPISNPITLEQIKKYFKSRPKMSYEIEDENGDIKPKDVEIDKEDWIEEVKAISSVGFDFLKLAKLKHNDEPWNLVTVINDTNKNKMPLLAITHVLGMWNDIKRESKLSNFDNSSLLQVLESIDRFDPLLEVEIDEGVSKKFSELSANDALTVEFLKLYHDTLYNEERAFIQTDNYADKSKILSASVDVKKLYTLLGSNSFNFTSDQIIDRFISIQKKYFDSVKSRIISDYSKIVKRNFKDLNEIEAYLEKTTSKKLQTLVDIYNSNPKNKINQIELINDFHYSDYKDGLSLNQSLKAEIETWTNKEEAWLYTNYIESLFVKSFTPSEKNKNKLLNIKNLGFKSKYRKYTSAISLLRELKEKFGYTDEDFDIEYKTEERLIDNKKVKVEIEKDGKKVIKEVYFKISDKDGNVSEPFKRYIWFKNLIGATVHISITKGTTLHPPKSTKPKFTEGVSKLEALEKEVDIRTVAYFKRMVLMGGSIATWKHDGTFSVPTEVKMAVVEDPTASVFNPNGQKDSQKTWDGGIPINGIASKLLIKSAPGADLSRVMKPLGTSIRKNHTSLLKCAFFGITNSMVRTSIDADYSALEWMRKTSSEQFDYDIFRKYELIDNKLTPTEFNLPIKNILAKVKVPKNGKWVNILSIGLTDKPHTYNIVYDDVNEDGSVYVEENVVIDNHFKVWELFGGALAKEENERGKLEYSEISMDAVADIIFTQSEFKNNDFKNKLIYAIVPIQGIKMGQANINSISKLQKGNGEPLSTFTYNLTKTGIQLNATHDSDESTVSEITQVLSALAERNATPEYFQKVYDIMGEILDNSLKEFGEEEEISDDKLNEFKKNFINLLRNSTKINTASAVLQNAYTYARDLKDTSIKGENIFSTSEKSVYKQFVASVIGKINSEFIRRKITGSGMIMNPSQGMIMIYQSNQNRTYLAEDVVGIFDTFYSKDSRFENNSKWSEIERFKAKLNFVLEYDKRFSKVLLNSVYDIQPLDNFEVYKIDPITGQQVLEAEIKLGSNQIVENFDGKTRGNDINYYYHILNQYKNRQDVVFYKTFNSPRDLAPAKKQFNYIETKNVEYIQNLATNVLKLEKTKNFKEELKTLANVAIKEDLLQLIITSNEGINLEDAEWTLYNYLKLNNKTVNSFNMLVTEKRFLLGNIKNFSDIQNDPYLQEFNDYLIKHNSRYSTFLKAGVLDKQKLKVFERYLYRLSQRFWTILDKKVAFSENFKPGENYFEKTLLLKDNTFDNLDYGIDYNNFYVNVNKIFGYVSKNAEKISSKLYNSQFNLQGINHADVNVGFFNNLLKKSLNLAEHKNYDLLLSNVYNPERAIQIISSKLQDKDTVGKDISNYQKGTYVVDANWNLWVTTGNIESPEKYFKLIAKYKHIDQSETSYSNKKVYKLNNNGKKTYTLENEFKHELLNGNYGIFETDDNKEIVVSKSVNLGDFVENNKDYFGLIDVRFNNVNIAKKILNDVKLKSTNYELSSYLSKLSNVGNIKQAVKLRNDYLMTVANEMFQSFKVSNTTIDSRIPAQAGQSTMIMDTVAYMHNDENSVYVSHWQLWYQGSDYDIDKDYVMAYAISNGNFIGWSPYFSLSSDSNKRNSFNLPLPSKVILNNVKRTKFTKDPDAINLDILGIYKDKNSFINLTDRINILNYIGEIAKTNKITVYTENEEVWKTIENHNSYYNESGFDNFKIYQIIQSSTSNRHILSASSPISFGDYNDAKKEVKDVMLNIYNPMSVFIQQENNFIGKDVIGIAATGVKTYFALITYLSKYFRNENFNDENELVNHIFAQEYNLGNGSKIIGNIAGLNLSETLTNKYKEILLDKMIKGEYQKKDGSLYTREELSSIIELVGNSDNPALDLSALLSAATDNAKELILADINAGVELASMHIYLLIMGYSNAEVLEFMTSDIVSSIKNYLKESIFEKGIDFGPESKIMGLTPEVLGLPNDEKLLTGEKNKLIETFYNSFSEIKEIFALKNSRWNKQSGELIKPGLKALFDESDQNSDVFKSKLIDSVSIWSYKNLESLKTKLTKTSEKLKKLNESKPKKNATPEDLKAIEEKKILLEKEILELTSTIETWNTKIEEIVNNINIFTKDLSNIETPSYTANDFINNFKNIYFHATELKYLGREMSINQGVKATVEEIYRKSKNLTLTVQKQVLNFMTLSDIALGPGKPFSKKSFNNILTALKAARNKDIDIENQNEYIDLALGDLGLDKVMLTEKDPTDFMKKWNNLKNAKLIEEQLKVKLATAIKAKHKYYTEKYITDSLNDPDITEMLIFGFNVTRYVNNKIYRDKVKTFYNLFKFNINIVDAFENLPHFSGMFKAFNKGGLVLNKTLPNHFLNISLPQILEASALKKEINTYKNLMLFKPSGNIANQTVIDKSLLPRVENLMIEILLKDTFDKLDYTLDFGEFIAENFSQNNFSMIDYSKKEEKLLTFKKDNLKNNPYFKIDFSTDYGIAKFKYLMENYIIPYYKKNLPNNKFLSDYTYKEFIGYNMNNTIHFYQDISNQKITIDIEMGIQELENTSTTNTSLPVKFLRSSETLTNLGFIELLTIYDNLVNLKSTGGNRSAYFLEKIGPDKSSFVKQWIKNINSWESDIDNKLKRFVEIALNDNNVRESLFLSLFGMELKSKEKGWSKSYYVSDPPKDDDDLGEGVKSRGISKEIKNRYFSLVRSLTESEVVTWDKNAPKETKDENKNEREFMEKIVKSAEMGLFEINC